MFVKYAFASVNILLKLSSGLSIKSNLNINNSGGFSKRCNPAAGSFASGAGFFLKMLNRPIKN
jgi:hypothetical protein